MKKLISIVLSASMIAASAAVPVLADYTASGYDITEVSLTYDDGTVTNGIDDTNALQTGDSFTKIFSTSIDTTKEFYLGFDFCFDNESGEIQIPKFKSNGTDVDKVGPIFTYSGGNLRTQTSSSAYQNLGAFTVGAWYHGEIEGRTGMGQQYTTFRLYKDGALVQETTSFNMRNISSESRSFNGMQAKNVSLDNVKLIQEKPDTITVSSDNSDMNAGTDIALDYVMSRQDKEFNKYSVTWSVYDATNTALLSDENISISESGILSALIAAEAQTVTVRASATFGDKVLYGTKQIKVNAVDTGDEKFDTIAITGPASVKAGTSASYSFTAAKDGADVTAAITNDDVVWGVYDSTGVTKNNNINITAANGTLTVDASVIAQSIMLRASSKSGAIYGQIPVAIGWSDDQTETVLSYSACETDMANTTLVDSWDGSKAYQTSDNITFGFGDQNAYTITEVDVKFDGTDGHGLTLYNNNGSENSNIRAHSGGLGQQTGGSKWDTILSSISADTWYHIEFIYLNGNTSGYNVYQYNSDGTKTLVKTMTNCNRRNDKPYGKITFTTGLVIDNLKVSITIPDSISVTAPSQNMFAGETAQFTADLSRAGHTLSNYGGLTWSVLDADSLPIIDGTVSITQAGLLSVETMAAAQQLIVKAAASNGVSDTAAINVQTSDVFTLTNIGVSEDDTRIVKLYADKNFYYNDDVVFIITVFDGDGRLAATKHLATFGDRLSLGSNELTLDFTLPNGFDPNTYKISGMVWTTLK